MNATKMRAKSHGTKAAFLTSLMSLILCFTMLVGTTLAWFTDTVTSGENQIIAGNLDVDVYYAKESDVVNNDIAGDAWKDLQNSEDLFTGALWEPGHTEVVYLKIVNKGTLALNYKMNVTPISESGGINQAGQNFKLSDYLVFGTTVGSTALTTYESSDTGRDAARAAAGTTQKLDQNALSKTGVLYGTGDTTENHAHEHYLALVVYMPEDVGNVANYKTGTTAPKITLGVTVYATQKDEEKDSFGKDYDAAADLTPDNAAAETIDYDFFPQINVTGQLVISDAKVDKGSTAGEETNVTQNNDGTSKVVLTTSEKVDNETAAKLTTVVNKGTLADGATGSLTLKVVKDDTANANFQTTNTSAIDTTKQDSTTYQVSVECEGVKAVAETEGKALYQVDLFIGKNRTNVKMYHNGTAMTEATTGAAETFTYDASTGYVTMYVNTFSPFSAVYDKAVAVIGTTSYYTLQAAVTAAASGDTIKLLSDCSGDGVIAEANDNFTIDFGGYTYTIDGETVGSTGTTTNAFQLLKGATVTFKNGTVTSTKAKKMIQNYCNLTLQDMNIVCDGACVKGVSNNCGATNILGSTSIDMKASGAVYALDVYNWPDGGYGEGAQVTINTTGTISGTISIGCDSTVTTMGKTTLNIQAGNFKNYKVSGYTATDIDKAVSITGGTFSVDPSAYVADGYKAYTNGTTPETWTVKTKTAPVPVDNVFTAANDSDLADVIAEINSNGAYWNTPVTIQLAAATYSGEYEIYQYPTWNGVIGNGATANNLVNSHATAPKTMLTIKGTEGTTFTGTISVWGFGYSNGGDPEYTTDAIYTNIENIDFRSVNDTIDEGHYPITATGASSNVSVKNCTFEKTARVQNGLSQAAGGYCYGFSMSDCTFTDTDNVIQGYMHGSTSVMLTNITATGTGGFLVMTATDDQVDAPIKLKSCSFTGTGYFLRLQNTGKVIAEDCTINIETPSDTEAATKNGRSASIVVYRSNAGGVAELNNCTISGYRQIYMGYDKEGNYCAGTVTINGAKDGSARALTSSDFKIFKDSSSTVTIQ